jgi:site-specific recombinase XerD
MNQLLHLGVDLSTIAHWLGHASVNTTNKYLSVDLEAKREANNKSKTAGSRFGALAVGEMIFPNN